MQAIRELEQQEAQEDLFFGQAAIIWARWFLILAGGILVLWNADDLGKLTLGILPIALLMAMNFYLHGKYLMERPVGAPLILLTSLLDLVIITLLVLLTDVDDRLTGRGPLFNQFFIFYYPMVLAFAVVMPRKIEVSYTVLACLVYGLVALISILDRDLAGAGVPWDVEMQGELKLLMIRIVTLAAMGVLGNYYFRIVRRHRTGQALAGAEA